MARFSNRLIRLARQRERDRFRRIVLPVSGIIGFIGLLTLGMVLVEHHVHGRWEDQAFVLGVSAAALPLTLLLFSWVRGHFNRQLENP